MIKDDKYYRINKYIDPIFDVIGWKIVDYIEAKYNRIKDLWQIHTKGFAVSETWELPEATARWILPRLKYYRDHFTGTPFNYEEDCSGKSVDQSYLTPEEWRERLDKMIFAFEFIINEDDIINKCYPADFDWGFHTGKDGGLIFNDNRNADYTYYDECVKKHEEGMKLYCTYYRALWD